MFKKISRTYRDYLSNFQNYLNSNSNSITDNDKDIFSRLEPYIIDANYSPAFNNYHFDMNKINQNNNIINCDVKAFWKRHKSHIVNMIEGASDSTECPVCGIKYREYFKMEKSVEHVLPKSKYHQYIFSPINLVYFCCVCNDYKNNYIYNRVFHPLFANITCQNNLNINLVKKSRNRVYAQVSISESNADYNFLINQVYRIPENYQKFTMQLINSEISSMESTLRPLLVGLNYNDKHSKLTDYIENEYHFNPNQFIESNTEHLLLNKIEQAINDHPELLATHILNRLHTLRDC